MSSAELAIVCALSLLGRSAASFPPIRLVPERPAAASVNAEAFVSRGDETINLIASAPAFVAARQSATEPPRCGNRRSIALLASILIHEEWHVRHGPDESGAYLAQLTALHSLGLGPDSREYHGVRRAMVVTLERMRAEPAAAANPLVRAATSALSVSGERRC